MSTTILGIDPGTTGSLAVLTNNEFVKFEDLPTIELSGSGWRRREIDCNTLADWLREYGFAGSDTIAVVEQMQARNNKMSRQSVCTMCGTMWAVMGVLAGLNISATRVLPSVWKPAMKIKTHNDALARARDIWPHASPFLTNQKDHNRADALLLATWYASFGKFSESRARS